MGEEEYRELFEPKLTRRQNVCLDAFTMMNREREYISTPNYVKPDYIKERYIKYYYENLLSQPIDYEYFKLFIQGLDDTFVDYSLKQVANIGKKDGN